MGKLIRRLMGACDICVRCWKVCKKTSNQVEANQTKVQHQREPGQRRESRQVVTASFH